MVEAWLQREIENVLHRYAWQDQGSFVVDVVNAVLNHASSGGPMDDSVDVWARVLPRSAGGFAQANGITRRDVAQALAHANILQLIPQAELVVGLTAGGPDLWEVFVSSAVEGLEDYREAAIAALDGQQFFGIRSEVMGASGGSPHQRCLRWARDCHTYILILAPRYGWVPPGESKSVTELEFEEAQAQNPAKILVYELDEKCTDARQRAFAQRVKDFKTGYFRATVVSPEDLAKCVQEDVASNIHDRATERLEGSS